MPAIHLRVSSVCGPLLRWRELNRSTPTSSRLCSPGPAMRFPLSAVEPLGTWGASAAPPRNRGRRAGPARIAQRQRPEHVRRGTGALENLAGKSAPTAELKSSRPTDPAIQDANTRREAACATVADAVHQAGIYAGKILS